MNPLTFPETEPDADAEIVNAAWMYQTVIDTWRSEEKRHTGVTNAIGARGRRLRWVRKESLIDSVVETNVGIKVGIEAGRCLCLNCETWANSQNSVVGM